MANYPYPTGCPQPLSGTAAVRPSTAVPGTMYYATDTKVMSVYDSSLGWISLGDGNIDATSGDIVAVGTTASAGSVGKAADAGHVHPGVTGHYAEYTASISVPNGAGGQVLTGGTWTQVFDTDSFGTALNANGVFTIPTGLGGVYSITANFGLPSATYTTVTMLIGGLPSSGTISSGFNCNITFPTTQPQQVPAAWTGRLAAGATPSFFVAQASGGARTATLEFAIARVSNT